MVLILHGLVTVALCFLLGWAFLGLDLSRAHGPGLALAVVLVALTTGALGLMAAALSLVVTDINLMLNSLVAMLLLLCGVNVPPDQLPGVLRMVSAGLPMTRGVVAARALVEGEGLVRVLPLLGGEALVGLVYLTAGYLLFLAMERRARHAGTLDLV